MRPSLPNGLSGGRLAALTNALGIRGRDGRCSIISCHRTGTPRAADSGWPVPNGIRPEAWMRAHRRRLGACAGGVGGARRLWRVTSLDAFGDSISSSGARRLAAARLRVAFSARARQRSVARDRPTLERSPTSRPSRIIRGAHRACDRARAAGGTPARPRPRPLLWTRALRRRGFAVPERGLAASSTSVAGCASRARRVEGTALLVHRGRRGRTGGSPQRRLAGARRLDCLRRGRSAGSAACSVQAAGGQCGVWREWLSVLWQHPRCCW